MSVMYTTAIRCRCLFSHICATMLYYVTPMPSVIMKPCEALRSPAQRVNTNMNKQSERGGDEVLAFDLHLSGCY